VWHVGVKETYLDVCGSWIAFSSQLTKWHWFHDGLAVSRGTLFFESYSAAGKCGSASQGIDMHDYFLGVRKSKTDDVFFPVCRLLA